MSCRFLVAVSMTAVLFLLGVPLQACAEDSRAKPADKAPGAQARPAPASDDPFSEPSGGSASPASDDPFSEPSGGDPFGDNPVADDPFADGPATKKKPERGAQETARPAPKSKPRAEAEEIAKKPSLRHGEDVVLETLDEPTVIEIIETPLADVVDFLSLQHRLLIHVDRRALDDVGIPTDTPITFKMRGVPLKTALELMLDEWDLTWTIKSGVLVITTPEEAESLLVARTYDVGDLLVAAPDRPFQSKCLPTATRSLPGMEMFSSGVPPYQGFGGGMGAAGKAQHGGQGFFNIGGDPLCATCVQPPFRQQSAMDMLIDLISSVVKPTTWDCVGGPGSMSPAGRTLVISQTLAVHHEIEKLLADLREARREVPTVAIQLRWLWLDDAQRDALTPQGRKGPAGRTSLAVDPEALTLLTREVPGYRGAIACRDGQLVYLASGDRHSAITSAIPVVGSGIGYQPMVEVPNVGLVLEVRPSVCQESKTAMLDVRNTVTRWGKPGEPAIVGAAWSRSQVKELPGEKVKVPAGASSAEVERPVMPAQQWAATVRVPLGRPVLLGGASFAERGEGLNANKGGPTRQLYLIATAAIAEP